MFRCIAVLQIALWLGMSILWAQKTYVPVQTDPVGEAWRWKQIPELELKGIIDFAEGPNGEMYFLCKEYLLWYDGKTWSDTRIPYDVLSDAPKFVYCTDNGILVGRSKGLSLFRNGEWEIVLNSLVEKYEFDALFAQQVNGTLFVGSRYGLLACTDSVQVFYTSTFIKETLQREYNDFLFVDVHEGEAPRMSFLQMVKSPSTDNYLLFFNDGKSGIIEVTVTGNANNPLHIVGEKYSPEGACGSAPYFEYEISAKSNHKGQVVLCSSSSKYPVSICNDSVWEPLDLAEQFGGVNEHYGLEVYQDSNLVVCGEGRLFTYFNGRWSQYQKPQVPIGESAKVICFRQKNGVLWVAAQMGEVFRVDCTNDRWKTYDGLYYQCQGLTGDSWFLTQDSKVVRHTSGTWLEYGAEEGVMDTPTGVTATRRGIILVTGSHNGAASLAVFNGEKHWKREQYPMVSWGFDPGSVYEDVDGSLLISGNPNYYLDKGQRGGYLKVRFRIDGNMEAELIPILNSGGLDGAEHGFARGARAQLYAAGKRYVWAKGSDDAWTPIRRYGEPTCLMESDQGSVWIGTLSNGLIKVNAFEEEYFSIENGLSSNFVIDIFVEHDSSVWVATAKNISHYNGSSWLSNVFPGNFLLKIDGGKMQVDKQRQIWISQIPQGWDLRGYRFSSANKYSTDFVSYCYVRDTVPPQVYLDKYSEKVDENGNTFIKWLGVDYWEVTASEELQYSYRVNNGEWSPFTYSNQKTFSGLEHGEYTFEVRARDKDGNISADPVFVSFSVAPPVHKRAWFVVFMLLCAVVVVMLGVVLAMRNRRLARANVDLKDANERMQEQAEELKQQNEEINLQNEEISTKNEILEDKQLELTDKNRQLAKSLSRLKVLSQFGQKLTATLSLDTINSMMYEYVSSVIDMTTFAVGSYDKAYNTINFHSYSREKKTPHYYSKHIDDPKSLTAWCFRNQKIAHLNNSASIRFEGFVDDFQLDTTDPKKRSMIRIPLTVGNERIGVLIVNSEKPNAYDNDDVTNLQTLASYIAVALDNANAYRRIDIQNEKVRGSIKYAQTIQDAILPLKESLDERFETFILFEPKDIVSGDFYWHAVVKDGDLAHHFLAVVDCTGHGVPGAFMSMIGYSLLNEAIRVKKILEPSLVLDMMDSEVRRLLKQDRTQNDDGMDVSLLRITYNEQGKPSVVFSGANQPIVWKHGDLAVERVRGTRKSIAGMFGSEVVFEQCNLDVVKGDQIYLFTDGIVDQLNPARKRFGTRRFILEVDRNSGLELNKQKLKLENTLAEYQSTEEQRDDITVVGIRL